MQPVELRARTIVLVVMVALGLLALTFKVNVANIDNVVAAPIHCRAVGVSDCSAG